MAQRRDWNALSSAYRSRLLRSGITREAYEGGTSLSSARGHKATPEHPKDIIGNAGRYQRYNAEITRLQQDVWDKKQRIFDNVFKWHEGRSREWIEGMKPGKVPGVRIMKRFMAMTDDEIEQKASDAGDDFSKGHGLEDDWYFLFYH